MIFSESLLVALRALRANKLRSLLTILGLIVGVAAVTTMMAVGAGAQQRVIEQIRSLGSNLLLVLPGSATSEGARLGGGTRQNLTESDATTIRNEIPFVVAAAPSVYGRAQAVRGNNNWQTSVQGITLDFLVARDWGIHWGRGFSPAEVDAGDKVALIRRRRAGRRCRDRRRPPARGRYGHGRPAV